MSVINRMLTDLERRGAPGARRQRAEDGPGQPESRRRALRLLNRAGPPLLLVALLIVAAGLWWQQWPRVTDLVEDAREAPAATDDEAAQATTSGEAELPGVRRFAFERDGATTRVIVAFDRPLEDAPGYGRSGDRLGLQLPARWGRDELPAPPSDQSVYRSAVVDERGDEGTRIGMRVDPEARFDLAIEGDRLVLTGRAPPGRAGASSGGQSMTDAADVDVGAGMEAVAATGEAEANTTRDARDEDAPASNGDNAAAARSESTDEAGQSDEAEPTEDESDATDAGAGAGADSANPGNDANEGDGERTRTAAAEDADDAAEAAGNDEAQEGQVRKSEPDVAPAERARRLEAKARDALDDGDVTAARDHLARALEFDADRHSARDLLVGLSLRSGDSTAARNLLAEGVARAPERAAYAKPFARLLVDAGDLDRALRVLRRAAPAADGDAGYHGLTAAVAQRLKRHELAASEYTRALEIDSGRGVWWMGLGISLRATDHPDEALAAFREARASGDLNERLDRWVQQRIDALSRTGE